ncbi:MAG TPA: hypothetical protein VM936_22060 [Pyrinomonadaceae bacterium]|nr:hypothetical protein [Pyrinomonadaceae bacterium]
MSARAARRLPGFRFETLSPPLTEWLPRMDVACFVGFAASGPLDVPVAVESAAHFVALYGADAPLAWDEARGAQAYAYLAPAVRSFFANGGRRCWVVRVADRAARIGKLNRARPNYFPVPGLACAALDGGGRVVALNPAFARARSEGSWSDALETGSALLSRSVEVVSLNLEEPSIELAVSAPDDVRAGDLLRLTFGEGYVLLLYVAGVTAMSAAAPRSRVRVRALGERALWLRTRPPAGTAAGRVRARLFNIESESQAAGDDDAALLDRFLATRTAELKSFGDDAGSLNGQRVSLELQVAPSDAPAPGSLVAADLNDGQLWVTVEQTRILSEGAGGMSKLSVSGTWVGVSGTGVWWTGRAPDTLPSDVRAAEKLSFELWVRHADAYALSIGDLGFHPEGARFWAQLPTDREVYLYDETAPVKRPTSDLWQPLAADQRFPLAGPPRSPAVFFPLGMRPVPEEYLQPVRLPGSALERDGLAEFGASLFLDPDLLSTGAEALAAHADALRYTSARPRPLTGLHAAYGIEEVTIIAVPDAVQRGWTQRDPGAAPAAAKSDPLPRPEWWRFDCQLRRDPPLVSQPRAENFLDCGVSVITPPRLSASSRLSRSGTFTLSWTNLLGQETGSRFVLEEATGLDDRGRMAGAVTLYEGRETRHTLFGRVAGDYFYRVRAVAAGGASSDWSNEVGVRVAPTPGWRLRDEADYDSGVLHAVQRALLRVCYARADLLAVLALPEHYREDKALEHVALLKSPSQPAHEGVPPLGYGEAGAFGYGALYHPWLAGRGGARFDDFRHTPPDGAACGVLARRALTRGAWVAPANEALLDVVALTPQIQSGRRLDLQDVQLNLIRQEARGFLALNADTLSDDEETRQINVRRLLILLRRLALRHGAAYVFEPNSPAFRRSVQRGFEAMLERLFLRGAFAGATAAASFNVVTGDALNTRQSVEQGRFVVELRVAPSQPLTFLTIRLVQNGERGVVTEVR